jgi:hypothetical protein
MSKPLWAEESPLQVISHRALPKDRADCHRYLSQPGRLAAGKRLREKRENQKRVVAFSFGLFYTSLNIHSKSSFIIPIHKIQTHIGLNISNLNRTFSILHKNQIKMLGK